MRQGETVLVVGGAGYIGSVVTAMLVERDIRVVVVDSLETGHRAAIHSGAMFEECDVRDSGRLQQVFDKHPVKAVMHFGAYSLVAESMRHPGKYFHNNVSGGLNILDAMLVHGVDRIVFSSTAATYGMPESTPITEDAPLLPINPYGRSKLAFEAALKSYEEAHGVRHAILRYFNAAGATPTLGEDHNPETHLIPLVLQVALGKRESIQLMGTDYDTPDGTCIRDYIHVLDLAEAHILALDVLEEKSVVCNLGNGQGYSVREVVDTARQVTGHAIPAVETARRPGDPPRLVASSERARSELGWRPEHADLERIIRSAWHWHEQHPDGYAS